MITILFNLIIQYLRALLIQPPNILGLLSLAGVSLFFALVIAFNEARR